MIALTAVQVTMAAAIFPVQERQVECMQRENDGQTKRVLN